MTASRCSYKCMSLLHHWQLCPRGVPWTLQLFVGLRTRGVPAQNMQPHVCSSFQTPMAAPIRDGGA